jgi:hypothetical protein
MLLHLGSSLFFTVVLLTFRVVEKIFDENITFLLRPVASNSLKTIWKTRDIIMDSLSTSGPGQTRVLIRVVRRPPSHPPNFGTKYKSECRHLSNDLISFMNGGHRTGSIGMFDLEGRTGSVEYVTHNFTST